MLYALEYGKYESPSWAEPGGFGACGLSRFDLMKLSVFR